VSNISDVPGYGLIINTADKSKSLTVPDNIEDFEDIKNLLKNWTDIKISSDKVTPYIGDIHILENPF